MPNNSNEPIRRPVSGVLYRQHFKMNASHNEDGHIKKMAAAIGVTEEKLRQEIKAGQERNRAEYLAAQDYTAGYRTLFEHTPKTTKDKYEELMDVGRFLLKTELNVQLHVPETVQSYPDFTIKIGDDLIGIEHSRIIHEKMKRATRTTQKLMQDAAGLLQQRAPEISGIVSLFVDLSCPIIGNKSLLSRGFTNPEREQIKEVIAAYVSKKLENAPVERPAFISDIEYEPNPGFPLSIDLGERYFAIGGFRGLAVDRIEAKEKRMSAYQAASGLNRIWLLLVVDGFSSHSGFDLQNELFLYDNYSEFEVIIVFEVFSGKYYIIYDKERF